MDHIEKVVTGFLLANNNPVGLLLIGMAALLEYVFPPFPGDMVTLFAAFLVTRYGWNLPLVFLSVLTGSGVGAMIDYGVGVWMRRPYEEGRFLKGEATRARVEKVLAAFRRHGAVYVAINRFLPAVRAVFFLAAGMAGLRARAVLFWALVSAAAWNGMVVGVGHAAGANWERLKDLATLYSTAAWGLLGAVLLGWIVVTLVRRRGR